MRYYTHAMMELVSSSPPSTKRLDFARILVYIRIRYSNSGLKEWNYEITPMHNRKLPILSLYVTGTLCRIPCYLSHERNRRVEILIVSN
jgi:hypothetical protein